VAAMAAEGCKVGLVEACEPVPGKSKLLKLSVSVGEEQPLTIVTNATNVELGSRVVVAPIGSTVGGTVVKKAIVGGQASEGMLCDAPMLGWKGGGAGAAALVPDSFSPGDEPPKERPRGGGAEKGGEAGDFPSKEVEPLFKMKEKLSKEEKKALAAQKKAERDAKKSAKAEDVEGSEEPEGRSAAALEAIVAGAGEVRLTEEQQRVAASRAVTGVLASSAFAWNVKFSSFSVAVGGNQLVSDCDVELNQGCRYGLIGDNGSGKSNVLAAIAQRDVPLPKHIDVFHLHEEAPPTEQSGVEAVIAHVVEEAAALEELAATIVEEHGPDDERLEAIYDRLGTLDPTGAEPRARKILSGLGFADHLVPMDRKTKHMSGGWRMRVSLAKALFAAPSLLLLDEPTNHLDLETVDCLVTALRNFKGGVMVITHNMSLINAVCREIWVIEGGEVNVFHGEFEEYRDELAEKLAAVVDEDPEEKRLAKEKAEAQAAKAAAAASSGDGAAKEGPKNKAQRDKERAEARKAAQAKAAAAAAEKAAAAAAAAAAESAPMEDVPLQAETGKAARVEKEKAAKAEKERAARAEKERVAAEKAEKARVAAEKSAAKKAAAEQAKVDKEKEKEKEKEKVKKAEQAEEGGKPPSLVAHSTAPSAYQVKLPSSNVQGSIFAALPNGNRVFLEVPKNAPPGSIIDFNALPVPEPVSVMASMTAMNEYEVVVPAAASARGSILRAMTPHGVGVVVPVPPEAVAGSKVAFRAPIPAAMQQVRLPLAAKAQGSEYTVALPAGVEGGAKLKALLPNGEVISITVPENGAGKSIFFKVPKSVAR